MQIKKLIILIFISTILIPFAHSKDNWKELNYLVNSEIQAIKQIKYRKSKLEYRLFELYSEKVKLIREKENKAFLKASPVEIQKKGKEAYFKKTRKAYYRTKRHGISILKRWPKTRFKPDIYYSMALNSRDYGKDGKAERYFRLTLKYAPKESKVAHSAKVSLAEYYYNDKKWRKAFRIYEDILKKPRDEFHSKHLYNSAWCLYQLKQFNNAVQNMHRAFAFSKNKNYININEQIFDFMALFHVDAKEIPRGVEFYSKNTEDPGTYLIKMAKRTAKKGQFKDTRYILKAALKESQKRKQREIETNIRLEELDVYRKYKKGDLHHNVSDILAQMHVKEPLKKEQHETAVKKIKDYTGYLQIRLTRNAKKKIQNYSKAHLGIVISYFDILTKLDKDHIDQYRFYQGETFYAVNKFRQAGIYYKKGVVWANENIDKTKKTEETEKFRRKLLDSMLATLAEGKLNKKERFEFSEFTYINYTESWPVDEKSRVIYERLFNLYFQKNIFDKAVDTISTYNKFYPKDIEKHRAMLGAIIDTHIRKKNTKRLAYWVYQMNKGLYNYDRTYIDKATIVLGQLLFQKIQKLESKSKDKAISMYERIYKNDIYPHKIKAEAALWISIIYLEKGLTDDSYDWAKKSFEFFPEKELFENRKKYVTMAKQYYLNQDFERAIQISRNYLNRFCDKKYKEEEELFKNLIQLNIAQAKPDQAILALKEFKKCYDSRNFEIISRTSVLNYYILHNKIDNFFEFYDEYKKDLALTEIFFGAMLKYYWHSVYLQQSSLNERITHIFQAVLDVSSTEPAPSAGIVSSIRAIFNYNEFVKNSSQFFDFQIDEKAEFDEKIFNEQLQQKVLLLKQLEDSGVAIIKLGQSDVMLGVYKVLNDASRQFSDILLNYNPKGMPEEFVISFKRSMKQLALNLAKKVSNNTRHIDRIIHKNLLLSYFNTELTKDSELRKKTGFNWPFVWKTNIVDFKEKR